MNVYYVPPKFDDDLQALTINTLDELWQFVRSTPVPPKYLREISAYEDMTDERCFVICDTQVQEATR